jgi:hypothetical protein
MSSTDEALVLGMCADSGDPVDAYAATDRLLARLHAAETALSANQRHRDNQTSENWMAFLAALDAWEATKNAE